MTGLHTLSCHSRTLRSTTHHNDIFSLISQLSLNHIMVFSFFTHQFFILLPFYSKRCSNLTMHISKSSFKVLTLAWRGTLSFTRFTLTPLVINYFPCRAVNLSLILFKFITHSVSHSPLFSESLLISHAAGSMTTLVGLSKLVVRAIKFISSSSP